MEDARVTVRLHSGDLQVIDALVDTGEFRDRSELIRRAIKDYLNSRAREVLDSLRAKQDLIAEAHALSNVRSATEAQKEAIDRLTRK